eukprot:Clim_evm3s149 gene=Clim_evmTU3s149
MSLNPNASSFNPNAAEFTPTAAKEEPAEDWEAAGEQAAEAVEKVQIKDEAPAEAPVEEKPSAPAVEAPTDNTPRATEPTDTLSKKEQEKIDRANKIAQLKDDANAREHVNICFIGHVDAGKSTIGGHLLVLTGMVDDRTLEKYQRESKEKNRETWYLSWALDQNPEERDKGKTVEVGRAFFDTEKKRYIVLDAPGHKGFVHHMIGGVAEADIGVLVISARKGEFETGFEKGGQTREHAMLAKTAGIKHLVVVINKMDDPTVNWDKKRYDECSNGLKPFLKQCGFSPRETFFMPISGYLGYNLKNRIPEGVCPWYDGPSLLEHLDNLPKMERMGLDQPLRMPVSDRFKEMGALVLTGKLESGSIFTNSKALLMPSKKMVEITKITLDEDEIELCKAGDSVKLFVKGIEEEDVQAGFVLCDPKNPVHAVNCFDAQVVVLDHPSIICAGFSCVLHLHTEQTDVTFKALLRMLDKKTGKPVDDKRPRFMKQGQVALVRLVTPQSICVEVFKEFPQLGRFTLRDETRTLGIGKVLKLRPEFSEGGN